MVGAAADAWPLGGPSVGNAKGVAMGRVAIACYKPKPGQEEALRALVAEHVTTLRSIGLATDRSPITMQAKDGTIIEVFEWAKDSLAY